MNTNPEETLDEALARNCPNMQPLKKMPVLFSFYGIGLALYGQRDDERETGTYVKTHVVTLLYLPILALSAYRVAKAQDGGWFVVGKEPISGLCKVFNMLSVVLMMGGLSFFGWNKYTTSPTYRSAKVMEQADSAIENQHYTKAAKAYHEVTENEWPDMANAKEQLLYTYDQGLRSSEAKEVAGLIEFSTQTNDKSLVEQSLKLGKKAADRFVNTDVMGASAVLKQLRKLAPVDSELLNKRISILKTIVQQQPENTDAKVELAEVYHDGGEFEQAVTLLKPIQGELKPDSQGALYLGKSLSQIGEYASAIPILKEYVTPKIKTLEKAEKTYVALSEKAYKKAFDKLDSGDGPSSFYRKLESATDEEQGQLVDTEISRMMEENTPYMNSIEAYQKANEVVPHAFDLGIAQLFYARTLDPGEEQTNGLKDAENTFISLQGSVGESDNYKLFLGQVKYWLGKEADGKKLFDELLTRNKRSSESLLMVAGIIRELGDRNQAGEYAEEAYKNSSDKETKQEAAIFKSLTANDSEEKLKWLNRADKNQPQTQVRIATIKSRMAKEKGDIEEAAKQIRIAVDGYEKMGNSTSVYNNRSLAYRDLFGMTGDPADYEKAANEMAKALELNPNDGIIVNNALSTMTQSAFIKVLSDRFDFKALKGNSSNDMLKMLYQDQAGLDKLTEKITQMPEYEKARPLAERVCLIAPKSRSSYSLSLAYYAYAQDFDKMTEIGAAMESVDIDVSQRVKQSKDFWAGVDEKDDLNQYQVYLKQQNAILNTLNPDSIEYNYQILSIAESQIGLMAYNHPLDLQSHLTRVEKIQDSNPSVYANEVAYVLNLALAEQTLSKIPEYKDIVKRTHKSLNPEQRLVWVLLQDEKWARLAKLNSNIKTAYKIRVKRTENLLSNHSPSDWALLQAFGTKYAEIVKKEISSSERELKSITSKKALNPVSAAAMIEEYCLNQMNGEKDKAEQEFAAGKEKGIPLP